MDELESGQGCSCMESIVSGPGPKKRQTKWLE